MNTATHTNPAAPPTTGRHGRRLLAGSALYVVAAAATFLLLPDYRVLQIGEALAYALAILGLNLVSGYAGQISLGHSVFFGLGAYTTTILVTDHGWSVIATLPAAAALGFVVGILAGLPALRLRGHYLALLTLGFAVVFPLLVSNLSGLTGGVNGKLLQSTWVIPAGAPAFLNQTTINFAVVAIVTGLGLLLSRNLVRFGVTRRLQAIRDNRVAAATSGINIAQQQTIAFGVSAGVAAVGGSLFVMMTNSVSPDGFGIFLAIQLLTGLLIGGSCTLIGPLIGGFVLVYLPIYSSNLVSGTGANMVYGALLVILMFLAPTGIAGGSTRLGRRIAGRLRDRGGRSQNSPGGEAPTEATPDPRTPLAGTTPADLGG